MIPSLNSKKSMDKRPVRWILGGLIGVTLYFQTNLGDPFNSPKLWIIIIVAAWLAGFIVSSKDLILLSTPVKRLFYLILMFNTFTLIATIFTDVSYFALFGETQRRNGFLSYLALATIMLASSIFIRVNNIEMLYGVSFFVGTISVVYALMQTTGNDFVKWNNPYNAVIGTMGNPNFAAAVMAIIGVMTFASLFINKFNLAYRISASIVVILLLFAIYRSNARQGLLSYILGVGVFLTIWLWTKNKNYGILAFLSGLVIFIFSVMGMLQIGPFEKYLYKTSVTIRGYYWNAGIEMLINHPFIGVGMDRYGDYFKEYRKVTYPLNYGFEITSSNAHNTFIQFFATGGLFLGLAYLFLNGYILWRAYVGIANLTGNNRIFLTGVFSAWVAFHAQSLISIDNIGISIWGWVLGGSIVGLSILEAPNMDAKYKHIQRKRNQMDFSRIFVSGLTTILALILVATLYRGESNSYNAAIALNSQDSGMRAYYKSLQYKVITGALTDPNYKLFAASNLVANGFIDEGIAEAKIIYKENNRSLDALTLLAITNEQLNKTSEAIIYREKIAMLDPWNAANYLALGKNYKAQGDLVRSKEMLDKILFFASANQIAVQAKIDLAP